MSIDRSDSASDLLEKYTGRRRTPQATDSSDLEADVSENFECYCISRNSRERLPMLELRKKCGNVFAIPYGAIEGLSLDPSEGIVIYAAGRTFRIRGRNLNAEQQPGRSLFSSIGQHRVRWIAEGSIQSTASATCEVENIAW